jgi:hypothetical protein
MQTGHGMPVGVILPRPWTMCITILPELWNMAGVDLNGAETVSREEIFYLAASHNTVKLEFRILATPVAENRRDTTANIR